MLVPTGPSSAVSAVRPNFWKKGCPGGPGAEHLAGIQIQDLVDVDLARGDIAGLRREAAAELLLDRQVE